MKLVGVISDTHGLMRPEALAALSGCELIIHAGDVGRPAVLEELRALAPVIAVRGNVDVGTWAEALPAREIVQAEQAYLYVLHNVKTLDIDPAAARIDSVISGHSHEPSLEWRDGVLFLNPGSAGPRRFRLPLALALLRIQGSALDAEIIRLDPASAPPPGP